MEDEKRKEDIQYNIRHGAFWLWIWPKLKTAFKLFLILLVYIISYSIAGSYMLLGLLTAPIWLLYARRYLTGKATPVIVADIRTNEAKVYEIYELRDWKLINTVRMGGILIAERIDVEKKEIEGPPIRGLGGLDFYINRDLFLRLRELYPRLLSELAEWKYATKVRSRREAVSLLAKFRLIDESGGEVESRLRRPILVKKEMEGDNEAGEQGQTTHSSQAGGDTAERSLWRGVLRGLGS